MPQRQQKGNTRHDPHPRRGRGLPGLPPHAAADWVWLVFALAAGVVGIVTGLILVRGVLAADQGTAKMREIAKAIQEGAEAFLKRQFRTIVIIVVPLAVLIFFTATKVTRPERARWP